MTVKMTLTGDVTEVNDEYALRLIEQGAAEFIPAPAATDAEPEAGDAETEADASAKARAKKGK